MREKIKSRLNAVGGVLGAIVWRGFGLFLFILGGAAGTGAGAEVDAALAAAV